LQWTRKISALARKYPANVIFVNRFDIKLAHQLYASSDFIVVPSRYEPCGLGQLIALRYGTIPVARKTGGLLDTIVEFNPSRGTGTGFLFSGYSSNELLKTIKKAHKFFNVKHLWAKLQKNAMNQNFSWRRSAEAYLSLYQKVLRKKD